MAIEKIKKEIESAAEKVGFIRQIEQIDETANTLKIRLKVSFSCYIQVYANIRKNLFSYVVVFNGQRVFGLDCLRGNWHQHPWQDPAKHQTAVKTSFAGFLFETYQGLNSRGII